MDNNNDDQQGEVAQEGPARKSRISFSARRAIVEREQEAVLKTRLESHLTACESFRKTIVTIVTTVSVLLTGLLGWLVTESYAIRGKEDATAARLASVENNILAVKDDLNSRAANIVSANISREATFNERFKIIEQDIRSIRTDLYNHQIEERRERNQR